MTQVIQHCLSFADRATAFSSLANITVLVNGIQSPLITQDDQGNQIFRHDIVDAGGPDDPGIPTTHWDGTYTTDPDTGLQVKNRVPDTTYQVNVMCAEYMPSLPGLLCAIRPDGTFVDSGQPATPQRVSH